MSKKVESITLEEFQQLIAVAIKVHFMNMEPIPKMSEDGIGKLESSLSTPFGNYYGKTQYPGILRKGAALFYFLCKDHSLANGNKRMACLATSWLFYKNGYKLNIPPENLYQLAIAVVKTREPNHRETMRHIRAAFRVYLEP
jgi:death-on-curing family protein